MTKLEIIHVRAVGTSPLELSEMIAASIRSSGAESEVIRLYRCGRLETDLAVHIERSGGADTGEPSELGLRLAAGLEEYGTVTHTTWWRIE